MNRSHVADQILQAGYRIRGTVRNREKGAAIKAVLDAKHGTGRVEILTVGKMDADGAFDKAVKGTLCPLVECD